MTHVAYLVPDAGSARAFLSKTLDLEVTADELTAGGEPFLTMSSAELGIELQVIETAAQPSIAALKKTAGVVDFILQSDDVCQFIEDVQGAGLFIYQQPIETPYGIAAIFEDPFGNLWDVVQRPEG